MNTPTPEPPTGRPRARFVHHRTRDIIGDEALADWLVWFDGDGFGPYAAKVEGQLWERVEESGKPAICGALAEGSRGETYACTYVVHEGNEHSWAS